MLKLKMVLLTGLATPVMCYYVYKALKERFGIRNPMKKSHLIILLSSVISLFITGYAYFLMLPLVLSYLNYVSAAAGCDLSTSLHFSSS